DAAVLSGIAAVGAGAACDRGGPHDIHAGVRLALVVRARRNLEGARSSQRNTFMTLDAAQLRSGKGSGNENFPVASWLVEARHRRPILAFYEFVRISDDIADHP